MTTLNEKDVRYDFLIKEIKGEKLTEEEKKYKEKATEQEKVNKAARTLRDA